MSKPKNKAYDELLAGLDLACKDARPAVRLAGPIIACIAAQRYLAAAGVPDDKLVPLVIATIRLQELQEASRRDGKPGPKPIPFGKMVALSAASAVVTNLKTACSVPEATRRVARAIGVPAAELQKFRDTIHRGTAHTLASKIYRGYLTDHLDVAGLQRSFPLSVFVKSPPR